MSHSLKPVVLSALVLACASFGDAFLYTAIPVNYSMLHIPVVWIGVLLSINRFVRLFANQLFAYWFSTFGVKRITVLAAIFAVLTTASYGMATHIGIWILARVIWGFCFSALRISTLYYSISNNSRGLSLGLNKGLQELGPVVGLLAGPILLRATNPLVTFLILAVASLSAVVIALFLPEIKQVSIDYRFSIRLIPSSFNLLTFLSFFFVQGVLIVLISQLLDKDTLPPGNLTILAGVILAFRRVCTLLIAPIGGFIADRWGAEKTYLAAYLLTAAGLMVIATGYPMVGIIVVFMFNSITAALGPGNVTGASENYLKDIAANNTWADIGAALGTFTGGFILYSFSPSVVILIATFVLLIACTHHIRITRFQLNDLLKWK